MEMPACGALDVWRDHLALLEVLKGSDVPLALPQWEVQNEDVGQCRECGGTYSWFKWRHNCGACGAVVCRGCTRSLDTAALPGKLRQHFGLGATCRICRSCDVRSKTRPALDSAAHHVFVCPYRCQPRLLFKRDLLTHVQQSCPLAPLLCYNKCGALTCRRQMHEHFEVWRAVRLVRCLYLLRADCLWHTYCPYRWLLFFLRCSVVVGGGSGDPYIQSECDCRLLLLF